MSFEPNYKKGTQYFYVNRNVLACLFIGGRKLMSADKIALHLTRPKPAHDYHRVELVVVRTAAECAKLKKKWDAKRQKFQTKHETTKKNYGTTRQR